MSRGLNQRFRRTADAATPGRATIEREKIRHRRPNDAAFEDDQFTDDDPYSYPAHEDEASEDDGVEWHDEPSSWDDNDEDEWVFDEQSSDDGIVWEDDAIQPRNPAPRDNFRRDDPPPGFDAAPEVELAGRRDVRPRPPKPPPVQRRPDRPVARGRQVHRKRPADDHPRPASPHLRAVDDEDDDDIALSSRSGDRLAPVDDRLGRPAPTRLTSPPLTAGQRDAAQDETSFRSRRPPAKRRQPMPTLRTMPAKPHRRWKPVVVTVVLALLVGGGWFVFQYGGADEITPTIESWVEALALPGSERTAADTSLGSTLPAEEAIADLTRDNAGGTPGSNEGGPLVQTPLVEPIDPATIITKGPPIPKFKPLNSGSRSIASPLPPEGGKPPVDASTGEAENAVSPSIFERIWSYLTTS